MDTFIVATTKIYFAIRFVSKKKKHEIVAVIATNHAVKITALFYVSLEYLVNIPLE